MKQRLSKTKPKKLQEDRLLKHFSLRERRRQEKLRECIMVDPLFEII